MALAFDFSAKRARVPGGQISLDVDAFYDEAKLAQASEEGILYPPIARGAGLFDLGGGRYSGLIVELLDGWQVEFSAGSYQAAIDGGTLIGGVAGQPVAYASGVQVMLNRPADAFAVSTSGGSAPSAAQNADAVWARIIESDKSAAEALRLLLAVMAGGATGLGSALERFASLDGAKVRLQSSVGDDGTRTVTIQDVS